MLSLIVVALLSADAGMDAGLKRDAGLPDAGVSKTDAGVKDGGVKDAGHGPFLAVLPTKQPDGGALVSCKQAPQICFSPEGDCDLLVANLIDKAEPGSAVNVIIYSLNRPVIVDALLRARTRATVRLIVDTSQIQDPKEQPQLRRLLDAGIPMKRDTHNGIMHMKVVVVNRREFLTGSFNFTNNASDNNDENMLVWDCQKVALVYDAKFEALWARFKDATELVMRDGG